jgi:hypothetical protein
MVECHDTGKGLIYVFYMYHRSYSCWIVDAAAFYDGDYKPESSYDHKICQGVTKATFILCKDKLDHIVPEQHLLRDAIPLIIYRSLYANIQANPGHLSPSMNYALNSLISREYDCIRSFTSNLLV